MEFSRVIFFFFLVLCHCFSSIEKLINRIPFIMICRINHVKDEPNEKRFYLLSGAFFFVDISSACLFS